MTHPFGPEPDEVEDDPEIRATTQLLSHAPGDGRISPEFRQRLHGELVAARAAHLSDSADRPPATSGRRRVGRALATVAVAAAVAAALVVITNRDREPVPVAVTVAASGSGEVSLDPSRPLLVSFSRPVDHDAVAAALRIAPATAVRTVWQGDVLAVTPLHGFAANAAYTVTIDAAVARTVEGAPFAGQPGFAFGTAPTPEPAAAAAPDTLATSPVSRVVDGGEAAIAADGSLFVTDAAAGRATGSSAGLVRIDGGAGPPQRLADATSAICVSRSGHSIAFLAGAGDGAQIVLADGAGTEEARFAVAIDDGSPLGWIDDAEVSFVAQGRLRSVDRSGRVRDLSSVPVDPAVDDLVISSGGRYVFLRSAAAGSTKPGTVLDLVAGTSRPLPGVVGKPAFSADAATMAWVDGRGDSPRLAVSTSGGGPVSLAPLPVGQGDTLSDLALSPDASRLVYSVTAANGTSELRLASVRDGSTVAVRPGAGGSSPNWASSGSWFSVLTTAGVNSPRIERVDVPLTGKDRRDRISGVAAAFARAQVIGDEEAARRLGAGLTVPRGTPWTRFDVVWLTEDEDGSARAGVRLTADAAPGAHTGDAGSVRVLEEILTLATGSSDIPPSVREVSVGEVARTLPGPKVVRVDPQVDPPGRTGAVHVTVDSDLDPQSLAGAIRLTTGDLRSAPVTVTYDAARRVVTVLPLEPVTGPAVLTVGTELLDIDGQRLDRALRVPLSVGS
jgi:Bacterial Ig-like domain